ncbi:MAG TPA: uracil-DNA glycosylase family protein [Pricia sp.]|nr:uracil-DNA glycosylase family protein [Pricia sp.]
MFFHTHPYPPFVFDEATKLIVGTLPPPRFSTRELKEGDVDFCYGSRDGQLWPILDRIFELGLTYANTQEAIEQRKHFLFKRRIGICDIVEVAEREKMDASDLGLQNAELRDLVRLLEAYGNIDTLLFTGGNSKNGPEYFFRRHLKTYGLQLRRVHDTLPRTHRFRLPISGRTVTTVSLTAPSGSANRAVGSMASYKKMKTENPDFTAVDFRVLQYRAFF